MLQSTFENILCFPPLLWRELGKKRKNHSLTIEEEKREYEKEWASLIFSSIFKKEEENTKRKLIKTIKTILWLLKIMEGIKAKIK